MVKYAHFDDSSINEPWGTSDSIKAAGWCIFLCQLSIMES